MKLSKLEAAKRYGAAQAVTAAVRSGALKRGLCEVCGAVRTEGHHDNYDKPLEVRWLCKKHHLELHAGHEIEMGVPGWLRTKRHQALRQLAIVWVRSHYPGVYKQLKEQAEDQYPKSNQTERT